MSENDEKMKNNWGLFKEWGEEKTFVAFAEFIRTNEKLSHLMDVFFEELERIEDNLTLPEKNALAVAPFLINAVIMSHYAKDGSESVEQGLAEKTMFMCKGSVMSAMNFRRDKDEHDRKGGDADDNKG